MLKYPILILAKSSNVNMQYWVVRNQMEFVNWFNIPERGTFKTGTVYDSSGSAILYEGETWGIVPNGILHSILENLLLPSLLYKVASLFVYFGPRLILPSKVLTIHEFRREILSGLSIHLSPEQTNAVSNTFESNHRNYSDIILGLNNWTNNQPTIKCSSDGVPR